MYNHDYATVMVKPETLVKLKELATKKRMKIYELVEALLDNGQDVKPMGPISTSSTSGWSPQAPTTPLKQTKQSKKVLCPHGIMEGGFCSKCQDLKN